MLPDTSIRMAAASPSRSTGGAAGVTAASSSFETGGGLDSDPDGRRRLAGPAASSRNDHGNHAENRDLRAAGASRHAASVLATPSRWAIRAATAAPDSSAPSM